MSGGGDLNENDNRFLVGDPCYSLPESAYSEVEIFDSPGGDGCWYFSDRKPDGILTGNTIGVDSGQIAVMPFSVVKKYGKVDVDDDQDLAESGIVFSDYPDIVVTDSIFKKKAPVEINGTPCDDYDECCECEEWFPSGDLEGCPGCYEDRCFNCWCGCDEEE
tara:strand:+ start:142 stop:627 length:486 start_codon:yes stop_codon:yes gene_type:complete